jgi:hypothetical protein
LTVCRGLVKYLRREGYWPKARELAEYLRADHAATVDCLQALLASRQVDRVPYHGGYSRYHLTARGFQTAGVAPIEPWRRVPNKTIIRRAINAAAARIQRQEERARAREEADSA